jgi:hypothetical protein
MFTPAIHEETTFERSQNLVFSKTLESFTMPAGDYEFPVEISLKDVHLETLTGPGHEYHTYKVEVVVERRMQWDWVVSEPLGIYRWRPGGISVLSEKVVLNLPYALLCFPGDTMLTELNRSLKTMTTKICNTTFPCPTLSYGMALSSR